MTMQVPDANIRSLSYYLAETSAQCPCCGQESRVIALAVPASHEILVEGEWQPAKVSAFLFYVADLPEEVRRRLLPSSSFFRLTRPEEASESCWANHCEHCDGLLSDEQLHCEPAGGFIPEHAGEAQTISLTEVRQSFSAAAAGYAPDPEFFAQIRRL
jgi:hypothetical protein